jgi:hypothetical protein
MKHTTIFGLYLALASFVGLIGSIVGYGTFGYEFVKSKIISDEEYVVGSRSYEIKSCEDSIYPPAVDTKEKVEPRARTEAEITKCKIETRERLIKERQYQLKDSAISGGIWGTLFLIIFLIHFPVLLRANRKEV